MTPRDERCDERVRRSQPVILADAAFMASLSTMLDARSSPESGRKGTLSLVMENSVKE